MTETTAPHTVKDRIGTTTWTHSRLDQENAQLREQLDDLHAHMDQLVDERLAELVTLQECDLQIHARLDADHVLNAVLDWIMRVTSAVAGAIYWVQEPKMLRAVAQRGYWPEMDLDEPFPWPTGQDILARALESGQPTQQTHISQDLALHAQPDTDRSHLAIPICQANQPAIGVFALESAFEDGFTAAQIDSAMRLAVHAALAIQNALRHQQVHQRLEGLLAVHQGSQSLVSCLDPTQLPQAIIRTALESLPAERAALYQLDTPANTWSLVAALNRDGDLPTVPAPSERTLIEAAACEKTTRLARDSDGRAAAALLLSTENLPAHAPQSSGEILAILYLALKPGRSSPSDLETLHLYAGQAAIALHNARHIAQLERAIQHRQKHASDIATSSRAPLTAIGGYARLMLQEIGGTITGQQREFLETILKNASHLESLLNKQLPS